jgi:hypothetical protein
MSPRRPSPGNGGLPARGLRAGLAAALPDRHTFFLGSLAWAGAMSLVAATGLYRQGWFEAGQIAYIALFFGIGGLLAFAPGIFLGRLLSRGRRDAGFAATFLALATATIAATALAIGLEYRDYYSTWHEAAFTLGWTFQFVFTVASAVYQFLVLGTRLYFPLGLVALAAASLWNVRGMR